MSTVHYQPSRSAIASEQYVRGDADERGVAVTSDVPGAPGTFATRAHALAEKHNREVEVLHYRQSYGPDFDPDDPEHVQRANDLGYLLAKKMHPHSDALVVTHTDGKGRKVHNHILVINHDNATGRALSQYRTFHDRPELGGQKGVQRVNDELMKEHGLSVARVKGLSPRDWELRREEFAEGGLDREAGDRMMAALMDPRCTNKQALVAIIDEQNDAIREWNASHPDEQEPTMRLHSTTSKKSGKETWTLYIEDLRGEGRRKEHRARTSTYSKEFTPTGAQEFFEFHQQQQQKETSHARTGQVEAGAVDIVGVDVEARRRRAAAIDVGEGCQRPDDVHEGQRRGDVEATPGVDLAAARASLDAAARRRDEEQARRDREDARRRRVAAEQQRSREAARRQQREALRLGRALDDDPDREATRDDGPELG